MRKATLKLAKPSGCKLVIKSVSDAITALNAGVTDKYRLFIIVESVEDAYRLAKGCEGIKSINFGGSKPREECTRKLSPTTPVSDADVKMLAELVERGVEVEIRQVPDDDKMPVERLLSGRVVVGLHNLRRIRARDAFWMGDASRVFYYYDNMSCIS